MSGRPQTPPVAADLIIALPAGIVLIERANHPYGWALPGGFVDVGEPVPEAARREAHEETGLVVSLQGLLGCYSAPDRDPRGHCVSLVYVATASGEPVGGDDARHAAIYPLDRLPALAFDHASILDDYVRFYLRGLPVPCR